MFRISDFVLPLVAFPAQHHQVFTPVERVHYAVGAVQRDDVVHMEPAFTLNAALFTAVSGAPDCRHRRPRPVEALFVFTAAHR